MAFSAGNVAIQLLLRNADGSTGLMPEADAITVNLSAEHKAILQSIAAALGAQTGDEVVEFGVEDVPFNTETVVSGFEVPLGKTFKLIAARGWADVDAEFAIKVDGQQVDGMRTTAAEITASFIYTTPTIVASAGQVVEVTATHFKVGADRTFKATILGLLE